MIDLVEYKCKKKKKGKLSIMFNFNRLLIYFIILSLFLNPLYGYLDPGTFSYIASVLVGALVGILMYAKIIWLTIKNFINKIFNKK